MAAVEEIWHRILFAVSNIQSSFKTRQKFVLKFLAYYFATLGLLLGACFMNVKYLGAENQNSFMEFCLLIGPAVPVFLFLMLLRWLLISTDELHRNTIIKGLLWGLCSLMLIIIPWGTLELMRPDMPNLRAFYLLQIFIICAASGMMYGHWKSGAFFKTREYDPWREPKA